MGKICFFAESVDFPLPNRAATATWLEGAIQREGYALTHLNIIFGSDQFLHTYNLAYLQHDTWTDILTFDYADTPGTLEGELYLSVERIQDNAQTLQVPFLKELHTVLVHGVLHLMGYADDTSAAQTQMRKKEAEHTAQLPLEACVPAHDVRK